MRRIVGALGFAVMAILMFGQPANAQVDDPALFEAMGLTNTCPANCGSVTFGFDPISSMTTVMYMLNDTIPKVVAGDVEVTEFGSSTVGDVLRFENIAGVADLFLFSADVGGGYPVDVGLPPSFQANTATIADNALGVSALYTPTSSQPGFCETSVGAPCSSSKLYQLTSVRIPEPASLGLLAFSIGSLGLIRRKRET